MTELLKTIRVLIVDDSAVVRRAIAEALSQDRELEVVGTACDPYVARDKILELNPDVLTLDVEMPRMDGLTFLRVLQQHRPMPVIIISSATQLGSAKALEALAAGAVDVIAKPSSAWSIGALRDQLPGRVKAAARARLHNCQSAPAANPRVPNSTSKTGFNPRQILVIGASTGGTEAIAHVLSRLPAGLPGICIVQHIPPLFSKAFADRLSRSCAFEVREAAQGDELRPNLALIAPGDYHLEVGFENGRYRVQLNQNPPLHHTRPSVDVLFHSAATAAGHYAVAVLLTGMGADGAEGMRKLHQAGAPTIAQDESTCVVYGMPRAAVRLGAVDQILPLADIPEAILRSLHARARLSRPRELRTIGAPGFSAPNPAAATDPS
jgi:two-component system, chemotaxis family, protein-glutamate methylesterase/glutaminase